MEAADHRSGATLEDVLHLQVDLPADVYRRACAIAHQEGWPEGEIVLTLLCYGLAYLRGEAEISRINRGDADLRQEVERFHSLAMELDSAHAVLKFRAYELAKLVKVLEMNVAGLRGENELAVRRLELFRARESQLKSENADLRSRLAALEACGRTARSVPPTEVEEPGALGRFRRWLARRR